MTHYMYDDSTSRLIAALVAAEPAFEPIVNAQQAAYGRVLPYAFMAEVTQWLATHGPRGAVLEVLDDAAVSNSADVRGVIYMSILDHLTAREPGDQRLAASLPPRLRAGLIAAGAGRCLD